MNAERFAKIEEVYHAVLEVEPQARPSFLARSCGHDYELRREIESLLSFADAASSLMDTPPLDVAAEICAGKKQTKIVGSKVGHYKIISQVGTGGMGEVFLAKDVNLERRVALKFITTEFDRDSDRLRRFLNEAKAASALNHPNIITVYEIGKIKGTQFIATEYIEGETLRERLRRAPLNLKSALDIAVQIASALQTAHEAGIIHRDIKPDNVMIRPDGLIKILDFGIAKLSGERRVDEETQRRGEAEHSLSPTPQPLPKAVPSTTSPGIILGTANYMSPEQARGHTVDARSDIFSFGILLFEMVTGKRAFAGENAADVVGAILHKELPPPNELLPGLPPEIERIINKTLRKKPDERYQTAGDLLPDLKNLRDGLELEAKATRTSETGKRKPLGAATRPHVTDEIQSLRTTYTTEIVLGAIKHRKSAAAISMIMLIAAVTAVYLYLTLAGKGEINSIAVMPFSNTSGDPNTEYLSDGISESLINELSKLSGVKVIGRDSVFKYKGKEVDLEQAAREMGVQAIVIGRVTQQGEILQISAELIDARDKSKMWGEQFKRKPAELLQVQDEIVEQIVENLRLRLTSVEKQRLVKHTKANPQAYELLLKGRFYQSKSSGEDAKKAVDYYNQALAIDPNYALAHAALARAYLYLGENSFQEPKETMPKATAAAKRALELDDNLPEAHLAMAGIKQVDWDWSGAEREYKRAIELNPNLAAVHFRYAFYLSTQGRHEQAIAEIKRARELDPLKQGINLDIGYIFYFARRYDLAIEQYEIGLELAPAFGPAHYGRGFMYAARGQYADAITEYKEMLRLNGDHTGVKCYLGYALAKTGQTREAQAILKQLQTSKDYVSPVELAVLYVGLGERENALSALERAYAAHDSQMQYLGIEPHFDGLRSDPRFADLMQKVGLTQ